MQIYLTLLRKKIKVLRSRIQTLEGKINNKFIKALKEIFNEDQIKALCLKKSKNKKLV